jgi:hypothetical protein
MDVDEFISRYPVLFHMAEAGAWASIQRCGLLSTSALLDLFEVAGERRSAIESERRDQIEKLEHDLHGRAVIRDNKPLREKFLLECLDGMSAREWYELLNRKVFFWLDAQRLEKLLGARAYRNRAHDVLTIDTRSLLSSHLNDITLCPINSGAALYPSAPRRGPQTFKSVEEYDFPAMVRWRGKRDAIVELTVAYKVSDIARVTLRVDRRSKDQATELIWKRND